MSGEVSYVSRFFVKFVEIIAAGLASAVSAYLLAHFGGLLPSSSTLASAPTLTAAQVGWTASEVAKSLGAQPAQPDVDKQRNPPKQDTDNAVVQLAPKDAKALPRKHTKTDTSAEKKRAGQKSAEAVARAALANVDAKRPALADAPIAPGMTDTHPTRIDVQPRQADVQQRSIEVSPGTAAIKAVPNGTELQLQQEQPRPATDANLQPRSPDIAAGPVSPVPKQPRSEAFEPLLPSASPSLEIAAPPAPPAADRDKGARLPDLLRSESSLPTGEPPRPPMPVGRPSPK